MAQTKRISLSLPAELVRDFDAYFGSKGIDNRSQACELIFRDYLTHAHLNHANEIVGILMAVFDHHNKKLLGILNDLQHDFLDIIISTQHVHLDKEQCMEATFVQGNGKRIQDLSDKLIAAKGIRLGRSLFNMV